MLRRSSTLTGTRRSGRAFPRARDDGLRGTACPQHFITFVLSSQPGGLCNSEIQLRISVHTVAVCVRVARSQCCPSELRVWVPFSRNAFVLRTWHVSVVVVVGEQYRWLVSRVVNVGYAFIA